MVEPEIPEKRYSAATVVMPSPALHPTHQRPGQVDQLVRHSASLHQVPGEDEARNGQQHEAVGPADDAGGQLAQVKVAHDQPHDSGQPHGKYHGRAYGDQQHETYAPPKIEA